jgi:hypothetical protein
MQDVWAPPIAWQSVRTLKATCTQAILSVELAQTDQDQQTAMLWEVLKYAANSPDVLLYDFHIFGLSKKKHALSRRMQVGVAQWIRQQPVEFLIRWDTPTCASMELLSKCLRVFNDRSITFIHQHPQTGSSCICLIYIRGIYTGYVNLRCVCWQQKIKLY